MKKFLAIYTGNLEKSDWHTLSEAERKKREDEGIAAWVAWGDKHGKSILDQGNPLGKTKAVGRQGISDIKNLMTGYVLIQAETHEAAAKMFEGHPHFTIFPGEGVEIMECMPNPPL